MPINVISESEEHNVIGKIRLGEEIENQAGKKYPKNVGYFVTTDVEEVARTYGETPTEIHGMFISDDPEYTTPTYLRLYGAGTIDANGKKQGGPLKCKGCGPHRDGRPGKAWWKNPATNKFEERLCVGVDDCPDAKNAKGEKVCKPTMRIFLYMPHCHPFGVFQIDTTSLTAIKRFERTLKTMRDVNRGVISWYPFKLVRRPFTAMVEKSATDKTLVPKLQYSIDIDQDPAFALQYEKIRASFQRFEDSRILSDTNRHFLSAAGSQLGLSAGTPNQELIAASIITKEVLDGPMEDNWPVETQPALPEGAKTNDDLADAILAEPEVVALFEALENFTKKKFAPKARKISVMKHIHKEDPLEAVKESLRNALPKMVEAAPEVVAEPLVPESNIL